MLVINKRRRNSAVDEVWRFDFPVDEYCIANFHCFCHFDPNSPFQEDNTDQEDTRTNEDDDTGDGKEKYV